MKIFNAMAVKSKKDLSDDEWREFRKNGLGGSDAGAILGLNPYTSAFQVYCDKLSLIPETEDNEAMRQGRDFEEYVAKRFEEQAGKKTKNCNYILQHKKHNYMLANIDRLVVGEKAGLECKTTSVLNKTDFSGGDVPPHYYAQCMHYMAVTGAEKWYLAILILNKGFYVFEIPRNEEEITALINAETRFWNEHILTKTEPLPDGSVRAGEVLKSLYPEGDEDISVDLLPLDKETRRLISVKDKLEKLEKEKTLLEQTIKQYMQNATSGYTNDILITWKNSPSSRVDVVRLKNEQPEIYNQYLKESPSRRFLIKEII